MENNNENGKPEVFRLWWKRKDSERRIPAGVAFYDEKYGEYRLKIDYLQALMDKADPCFYLRTVGSEDNKILFRAETVLKKDGRFMGRRPVGEGYSSKETDGEVYIDFGPHEKLLVMTLKN